MPLPDYDDVQALFRKLDRKTRRAFRKDDQAALALLASDWQAAMGAFLKLLADSDRTVYGRMHQYAAIGERIAAGIEALNAASLGEVDLAAFQEQVERILTTQATPPPEIEDIEADVEGSVLTLTISLSDDTEYTPEVTLPAGIASASAGVDDGTVTLTFGLADGEELTATFDIPDPVNAVAPTFTTGDGPNAGRLAIVLKNGAETVASGNVTLPIVTGQALSVTGGVLKSTLSRYGAPDLVSQVNLPAGITGATTQNNGDGTFNIVFALVGGGTTTAGPLPLGATGPSGVGISNVTSAYNAGTGVLTLTVTPTSGSAYTLATGDLRGPALASGESVDNGDGTATVTFTDEDGGTFDVVVTLPDGVVPTAITANDEGSGNVSFTFTFPGGNVTTGEVYLRGATGPAGETGLTGAQGEPGEAGDAGASVESVDVSVDGDQVTFTFTLDDETTVVDTVTLGAGVTLATLAPAALGTAAVGVSTKAAREDHVHAKPTPAALGALATDGTVVDIKRLSQAAYDALSPRSATTLYVVTA